MALRLRVGQNKLFVYKKWPIRGNYSVIALLIINSGVKKLPKFKMTSN